jgi:hypothetical protein
MFDAGGIEVRNGEGFVRFRDIALLYPSHKTKASCWRLHFAKQNGGNGGIQMSRPHFV